jgi:hypothetical protein
MSAKFTVFTDGPVTLEWIDRCGRVKKTETLYYAPIAVERSAPDKILCYLQQLGEARTNTQIAKYCNLAPSLVSSTTHRLHVKGSLSRAREHGWSAWQYRFVKEQQR